LKLQQPDVVYLKEEIALYMKKLVLKDKIITQHFFFALSFVETNIEDLEHDL
jgi:hypothetical protein